MRYLLAGCGYDRARRLDPMPLLGVTSGVSTRGFTDGELFTLDENLSCAPDLLASLDVPPAITRWFIAQRTERCAALMNEDAPTRELQDNLFDEIHAYEVLEHLGTQGDAQSFFATFLPFWHALRPDGFLCGTVPSVHSEWAWGDPGHRRVITAGSLRFLDRELEIRPPSSDYRAANGCDFKLRWQYDNGENLAFVLQAVKPARPPREISR